MSRLGLWGAGTNFPIGFEQFAEEIESEVSVHWRWCAGILRRWDDTYAAI
ncbi:MAG: hypothetical protein IPI76_00115 [Chloracidobacterium sp.]|nr:hypothetical protein [Chloracidobacterium sp.]